jgi:hypothetical protein
MGITIAYRGRLADLGRIEDYEDRLLDFALDFGGLGQIWRSHADDNPQRMVRGVILDLAPGQESTSLLVSPEGWLIGLVDVEDAEHGRLTEPPWCFTKTQFGSLEGHVALVEMLTALKREFMPDLEVSDEGGYYPARDLAELVRRRSLVQGMMDGMVEGFQRHGLSREAAEDSDILLHRIERIAAQVHRILRRPAEHSPVSIPDGDLSETSDPDAAEALWDDLFKENRRRQEQLQRALEERLGRGEKMEQALENALGDLGLDPPGKESGPADEAAPDDVGYEDSDREDAPFEPEEERHPLVESAMDLLKDLHGLFRDAAPRLASSLRTLFQGAGDAMGGLVQALSGREEDDLDNRVRRVAQLKRALRGVAFARGALYSLRAAVTSEQFDELRQRLEGLEQGAFGELGRLRSGHQAGDL